MKNIGLKLAAVFLLGATSVAQAGHGGSAGLIQQAIASHSQDAIIAELEHTETLVCDECVQLVTNLTEDSRYEVRQVAAWWFARRGAMKQALSEQFLDDLAHGDAIEIRNAADFLGATRTFTALPAMRAAMQRDSSAEAHLAIVRAVGFMAHKSGNDILVTAMSDRDAGVRAAAVTAWRDMLGQQNAQPVVALLGDADAHVRAEAATVVGGLGEQGGRAQLEALVLADGDSQVRRNAAWSLGQLGNASSRTALTAALGDKSGLVRGVAKASLALLR